jgi:hypothetical protein
MPGLVQNKLLTCNHSRLLTLTTNGLNFLKTNKMFIHLSLLDRKSSRKIVRLNRTILKQLCSIRRWSLKGICENVKLALKLCNRDLNLAILDARWLLLSGLYRDIKCLKKDQVKYWSNLLSLNQITAGNTVLKALN